MHQRQLPNKMRRNICPRVRINKFLTYSATAGQTLCLNTAKRSQVSAYMFCIDNYKNYNGLIEANVNAIINDCVIYTL